MNLDNELLLRGITTLKYQTLGIDPPFSRWPGEPFDLRRCKDLAWIRAVRLWTLIYLFQLIGWAQQPADYRQILKN